MDENIIHVLLALISALGSVGAWRFYETKVKSKAARFQNPQKANENFIADLQARVAKLESLSFVHLIAHCAFLETHGMVSIALNNISFLSLFL